ncbi:MAG: LysM peptidoglycan-binding domain-containing protein [Deltaproteobacteria bacterium]|nr:LysM peptidoglycan-binding domain-containing protein [Deltaproteobacteria bacterium]
MLSLSMAETRSPDPPTGVLDRISRVLDGAGLDVNHALYDEAVDLARQGLLGPAHDRIRMLLCLDPDDGSARLMLAKILVAQCRWSEALAALDAAREAGAHVPPSLQAEVETNLDRADPGGPVRVPTRDPSEMRSMRDETRRLRTENTRLLRDRSRLKSRVGVWSTATAILAGVCIVLLACLWAGAGSETPEAAPALTAADETPSTRAAPLPEAPRAVGDLEPAPAPVRRHVVQEGDTLYALAARYYGNPSKWEQIRAANRDKVRRGAGLRLGDDLVIP